jgi:hypothetical protein
MSISLYESERPLSSTANGGFGKNCTRAQSASRRPGAIVRLDLFDFRLAVPELISGLSPPYALVNASHFGALIYPQDRR